MSLNLQKKNWQASQSKYHIQYPIAHVHVHHQSQDLISPIWSRSAVGDQLSRCCCSSQQHSQGCRPGRINGHRSGHSTPVTHCLHLSSARSDRKLRHLSSSCSDLSPQLVSSLPLAARVSLTPRTPRSSRSRGSTPGMAVTAPPSPSKTEPCSGRRALLTGRGKA